MGRPATGSARWNQTDNVWEARVSLPGVGRDPKPTPLRDVHGKSLVPPCLVTPQAPPSGCSCESCAKAKRVAKIVSDTKRREALGQVDTVSSWYADYYKQAAIGAVGTKNRGKPQSSVDSRRIRFGTWIEPLLGAKAMADVTAADIRGVVQKLDEAIRVRLAFYAGRDDESEAHRGRKPGLSAKTAQNVYGEVTSGFREAVNSKLDALRILEVDPTIGVRPPTTGEDREQAALYPDELVRLLSAPGISRARRRVYFGALYTGCRRSELLRMTAADVDLEHDLIRIRGKKTNAARREIPIEPALRPLLEQLVKVRKVGPLFDVPRADGKGGTSDLVKKDLVRAQLDRVDLLRDDAEHMPFTFHGLRHTAITHWAVAGRPMTWLLVVAGHTSPEMTRAYLDKAAVTRGKFGTPHPALPPDVLADLLSDLPEPVEAPAVERRWFCQGFGFLPWIHKSKEANSAESASILTVAWRPQWELKAENERRFASTYGHQEHAKMASVAIGDVASDTTLLPRPRPAETDIHRDSKPENPRPPAAAGDKLVRLAAIVRLSESLTTGDVRILLGEGRRLAEDLCGPVAAVVAIDVKRRRT